MKYLIFLFFFKNILAQLFESLSRLPPPAIYQTSIFKESNEKNTLFQLNNSTSLPQFIENNSEQRSPIIKELIDKNLNKTAKNLLQEEENKENGQGKNFLPDFIRNEIAPKQANQENSLPESLNSLGISLKNKTLFLDSDLRISILNSSFSMKQIEKLVSFNLRLMKKCGENLEFCMIRDNVLDEEVEGALNSEDSPNDYQNFANSAGNMKFLQVDNSEKSLQTELDELLSTNEESLLSESSNYQDFDIENI